MMPDKPPDGEEAIRSWFDEVMRQRTEEARRELQEQRQRDWLRLLALGSLMPFALAWHGWVLFVLWGWFIQPLGAPELGWLHAVGLAVILGLLTRRPLLENTPEGRPVGEIALHILMRGGLTLFFGGIVQFLMTM